MSGDEAGARRSRTWSKAFGAERFAPEDPSGRQRAPSTLARYATSTRAAIS
jgi:hypothetical protein